MAIYSIKIDLDDGDTLDFLHGKSLRVYKSVGSGATGLPVVWFSQNVFSDTVTFSWTEQYAGYVKDGGTPTAGISVADVSAQEVELGQKLIALDNGRVKPSNGGVPGAITVKNTTQRDWMCGMGQEVNGQMSPICAFDLGGIGQQVIMEPYEKVLLVFESTDQIDTGTVVARAISASLTVELDGVDLQRTVYFRKLTGWSTDAHFSTNIETWAKRNDDDLDLVDALIAPPA